MPTNFESSAKKEIFSKCQMPIVWTGIRRIKGLRGFPPPVISTLSEVEGEKSFLNAKWTTPSIPLLQKEGEEKIPFSPSFQRREMPKAEGGFWLFFYR